MGVMVLFKKRFLCTMSFGVLSLLLLFTALMPALASNTMNSLAQTPSRMALTSTPSSDKIGACSSVMMDLTSEDLDREFQAMQDAGIKWVRCTFSWAAMEVMEGTPPQRVWHFEKTDSILQKAQQYGVNILGIIGVTPGWVPGSLPNTPPPIPEWKNAVWTICDRYKQGSPYGEVMAWEIWNEENTVQSFSGTAATYAELLKAAGEAIKIGIPPLPAANPNATVILGGLASNMEAGNDNSILEYMGDCLTYLGSYGSVSDYIDAVAYHTYTTDMNSVLQPEEKYCRGLLKTVRDLVGSELEIWITEFGWSLTHPLFWWFYVNQDTQAAYNLRTIINYAGINTEYPDPENMADKVFLYDLRDELTSDPKGATAVGASGKLISTMYNLDYCDWGPLDPGIAPTLNGVAASDAFNVWTVGANGTVGALYCGVLGSQPGWIPYNSGTTNNLYAVSCPIANHVWTVGASGTILLNINQGQFVNKSQASFGDLVGVSAVDGSIAWAVGSNGVVHKTLDGATTWSNYSISGVSSLSAVSAIDAQTAYVVGASGVIRKTTDGGTSWINQDQTGSGNLKGISAPSATTAYAVGLGGIILVTNDGGSTWTAASQSSSDLYAVASEKISPNVAWAVGAGGVVYKTINSGQTWYAQNSGTTNTLYGATAIDYDWNPLILQQNNYGAIGNDASQHGFVLKPLYHYVATFEDIFEDALPITNASAFAAFSCANNNQLELHAFEKADGTLAFSAWRADDASDSQFAFTLNNTGFGSLVKIDPSTGQSSPVSFTRDSYGRIVASNLTIGKSPLIIEARIGPSITSITSITPNSGVQGTALNITDLAGSGFIAGATVKLMSGDTLIEEATNVVVVSSNKITCTFPMMIQTAGAYDVVVTNTNGQVGRLPGGFTVTAAECGTGSGAMVLLLGVMMGLMSLAGAGSLRRRKRKC
jgi:photosystem II stability/assembly factor-like uncharacterized protein